MTAGNVKGDLIDFTVTPEMCPSAYVVGFMVIDYIEPEIIVDAKIIRPLGCFDKEVSDF